MASIYPQIRAALEVHLSNTSGLPDIAWENVSFSPTTGEAYIKPRFVPTRREPAVRGTNPQQYYQGMLVVECYVPEDSGPSAADELADKIIDAFDATTDVTNDGTTVSIRYAERDLGILDGAFYKVPVTIGWYIYS